MDEFAEETRVGLCGWEGFFGTVLEVVLDHGADEHQILVRWDHPNDDGQLEEWVSSTAIFRVED
jgi:hypothetical protein